MSKFQEEAGNRQSRFQAVKGMRDFWPGEMVKRQFVLDVIRKTAEKWGFLPMDTPALESFELLAAKGGGGEEIKKEIYYFKDQGDRELGLRFDLTVPTARVIASKLDLPLPFKRYQTGKVWRYDNPQAGRYREFQQFDLDIFGSTKPEADAEIIAATCDVFDSLGFEDFVIRLNNRKLIEAFVQSLKIENVVDVFRSVDKLDKIGEDGVKKELVGKLKDEKKIQKILNFIKTKGDVKVLDKIEKLVGTDLGKTAIQELRVVIECIKAFGYDKNVQIDLSLIRGLEYYTGSVFEVAVSGGKLSLAGGGRYDNMIEAFGGRKTPAVGIGLGFERIVDTMIQNSMVRVEPPIKLFVVAVNDAVRIDALKICQRFRREGIPSDFDVSGKNLSGQLKYASSASIPWVIFVGEKELKEKKFKLRDMVCGEEKTASLEELVKEFRKAEK